MKPLFVKFFVVCLLFNVIYAGVIDDLIASGKKKRDTRPRHGKIFHSYRANTGSENREDLYFSNFQLDRLELDASGKILGGVTKWELLQNFKRTSIVGFNDHQLVSIGYDNDVDYKSYVTELSGKATDITTFHDWNTTAEVTQGYAVVAVERDDESWLHWYRVNENEMVYLWDWPVHRKITHLEIVKIDRELKLFMLSHGISDRNSVAEMYGFKMEKNLDLWLIDRISFNEIPSSVAISDVDDYVYLSVSLPKASLVHVFQLKKYTAGDKHFESHQEIFSPGVVSLASFNIKNRRFLSVAASSSKIYRFGNYELHPASDFDLGSLEAVKIVQLETYRRDVMIFAKKADDIVVLSGNQAGSFKLHGNLSTLLCKKDSECLREVSQVQLENSAFFLHANHRLIFSSDSNRPSLLKFSVELKPVLDDVELEWNEIYAEVERLQKIYDEQQLEIKRLMELRDSLINDKGEIELNNWVIGELRTKKVEINSWDDIKIENLEIGHNKDWTLDDLLIDSKDLQSEFDFLNKKIKEVKVDLMASEVESNELSVDTLPEFVNGGLIAEGSIYVDELEVETINGEKVDEILNDLYRVDQPKKISGSKTISKLEAEDVSFERLNDIPAADILFADEIYENSEENVINGDLIYENDLYVMNDVTLLPGGSVNNMKLASDIVRPNVMYNPTVKFEKVKITDKANIRTINKKPLIIPIHNKPFDIHTLDSVNQARIERVNVKNDLNVTFINGKNFTELMENLIFTNGENVEISGVKINGTFSAAELDIEYLNGLKFPEDFVFTSSEDPIIITGEKEFLGDLIADTVDIGSNDINGARSLNSSCKSINLQIDGILYVDSLNNHSWDYFTNIVRKDEKGPVVLSGLKKFKNSMKVKNLKLNGTLNDKNPDDVLTKNTDQVIRSPITLKSAVFKNLTLGGTYDGVCVKCLNESIVRITEDGVYESHLIFNDTDGIVAEEFNILEALSHNFSQGDIKFENGSLVFNGDVTFGKVKADSVRINGSLKTFHKLNNVNLTELENLRLSKSRPQLIYGNFTHENLTLRGKISVLFFNGKNLLVAEESESTEYTFEKILGSSSRFKYLTVRGKIKTNDNVNNVNLTDFQNKAINIIKGDEILNPVTFEDPVHFKELNLTDTLDGINLRKLKRDVVRKNQPVFLRGKKNFLNGLTVVKNLRIRTLNSHLIQDIATVQGDHIMNNTVIVNGNVVIMKNLTLHGSIDDLAIQDLQRKFSTEFDAFIIPGDWSFKGEKSKIRKLTVGGMVNDVNFDDFMWRVVWKDRDFFVDGNVTFLDEVQLNGNLTVEKTLNKLNFTAFSQDIVMKNQATKINGSIVLWRAVLKNLNVKYDYNTTLLNGKDTNEWVEESIPLDEDVFVSGEKSFEFVSTDKDISADFINGHSPETMITLKNDQYIPDPVTFSKIKAKSNVLVEGKVNGRNLKEEWENTVMVAGDQTIDGKVTFEKDLVVDGDVFIPSANGVVLDDLVTLNTDQVVKTVLSFEGPVEVDKDVKNVKIVNGIDVKEWDENAVLLNREQTITGTWNILGNVTAMKNVDGNALLNSVSVPILAKKLEKLKFLSSQNENDLDLEYQWQCEGLRNLSEKLVNQPYLFREFNLVQTLDEHSPWRRERADYDFLIESVITFEANKNNYLILTFIDECYGDLYKWNNSESGYIYLKQMNLGPVYKWMVLNRDGLTYLVTTSISDHALCDEDLKAANLWVFEDEEKYGHVFTTEAFSDLILSKNNSHVFYTIRENGFVHEWTLKDKAEVEFKLLKDVGKGNHKFIDLGIFDGLTLANLKETKKINFQRLEFSNENLPSLYDGDVDTIPINGKFLTAVGIEDKIKIYNDILAGDVMTEIYVKNPKSLIWFHFGQGKEIFLIFQSKGKSRKNFVEIFEYKGTAGFQRRMSLHISSQSLQTVTLPDKNNVEFHKYLIIIQRKKMHLLRADMFGHLYEENDVDC